MTYPAIIAYRMITLLMDKEITDWDIQAYLDNELDWEMQKQVLNSLETNPDLRRRYNAFRRQKELLQAWWKDH